MGVRSRIVSGVYTESWWATWRHAELSLSVQMPSQRRLKQRFSVGAPVWVDPTKSRRTDRRRAASQQRGFHLNCHSSSCLIYFVLPSYCQVKFCNCVCQSPHLLVIYHVGTTSHNHAPSSSGIPPLPSSPSLPQVLRRFVDSRRRLTGHRWRGLQSGEELDVVVSESSQMD